MTVQEFRNFKKTKVHVYRPIVLREDDRFKVTPNLACSIEELMIRLSQGLPMPNLTPIVHTAFNGYDIDNLPVSARKGVDMIDVMNDLKNTKEQVRKVEDLYKYDVAEAIAKLNKDK